jgi:thiol-disulfide isomerase/thioredoxin
MEDRKRDRARLGEAWRKSRGTEAGLGDLLLAAFDRTQRSIEEYRSALRKLDPNSEVRDPMEFTVSGLNGETLRLASHKGKVVVLDFWATWCGPCRAQQPLYEQVKDRYKGNPKVMLLNINTDENKEVVKPFLEREKWNKTVYFEDGLSSLLRVSSIPTTIVINPRGEISSRMNGYIAERFVDMLGERIEQALGEN